MLKRKNVETENVETKKCWNGKCWKEKMLKRKNVDRKINDKQKILNEKCFFFFFFFFEKELVIGWSRHFDVDTTLFGRQQCCYNVKTTSGACWEAIRELSHLPDKWKRKP